MTKAGAFAPAFLFKNIKSFRLYSVPHPGMNPAEQTLSTFMVTEKCLRKAIEYIPDLLHGFLYSAVCP